MPSPFPGMDPYLENSAYFPAIHSTFLTYLREYLQPILPEPYFAETSERIWLEMSQRRVEPDVDVFRRETPTPADQGESEHGGGAALAVETISEPVLITIPDSEQGEQMHEGFLEIYAHGDRERLVTSIELLSLSNKTRGEKGQEAYLRKQREVLDSQVNLVEIDLLRAGQHTTAVPLDHALEKTGPFHYHVCIHRFDNQGQYLVYPITLDKPLPTIAIPLLPGDGPVKVNLQTVLDRCYDTGPYRRRIRYADREIVPPLSATWNDWVTEVLTHKGTQKVPNGQET